jgi:phosphohistidine phosphatase
MRSSASGRELGGLECRGGATPIHDVPVRRRCGEAQASRRPGFIGFREAGAAQAVPIVYPDTRDRGTTHLGLRVVLVILVRHAQAAAGEPDELRPLTPSGHEAARLLGLLLADRSPDAVVSSPLLRARETAEALASAAVLEPQVDEGLAPGATVSTLRAAVAGLGETVIAVGHQPDCGEIVLSLTGREVPFPTAGFAELEL